MTRLSTPILSLSGQQAIDQYMAYLLSEEDLSSSTVRNYLSDLRQFAAWCELTWEEGQEAALPFEPGKVATPTITRYRSHLQSVLKLKPATVNRSLVTLKRLQPWHASLMSAHTTFVTGLGTACPRLCRCID